MISAWLANQFLAPYWPLAEYLGLIAVISILCACQLFETARKDISAPG